MTENRQTLSSKVTTELVFWHDESIVVVSVIDRIERGVNKQFDNLDIDWKIFEK